MLKDILINELKKFDNVLFCYLFGSYATNGQTSMSDIDIAVYLKDTSLDSQLELTYKLSKIFKQDIDLVVLNDVKNIYLLENILSESIVVKDSEDRIDFELIKEHDILDYKAFKKYIDAA